MPKDTDNLNDETNLIDVSNLASKFEDEATPIEKISSNEEKTGDGFLLAPFKERFAAFFIDITVLYIFYWVLLIIYRLIAFGSSIGPIPAAGLHGIIFHSLFLILAFLYFFIFELIFFASPGKRICHLSIRNNSGDLPEIKGIFWRNFFRLIDILLFPTIIGFLLIEKTSWHQRLGDLVGKTVIIKKLKSNQKEYEITYDMLASASCRIIAFAIDFFFFIAFVFGYLLILNPDEKFYSMILIVFLPVILIVTYTAIQTLSSTSVGKYIFGYRIYKEDGSNIDFASSLMRIISRPFDSNPFGFLCMLTSSKKQRPGDLAANTLVCKVPRQVKGLLGAIILFFIVSITLYSGLQNRDNFLSSDFKINFLPIFNFKTKEKIGNSAFNRLIITDFYFAANSVQNKRSPAIFEPGETLFLNFKVNGPMIKDDKAWVQEDILVRYPDDSIGLTLENVIDYYEKTETTPIELSNNIVLPETALTGRYTITITLRDKNADIQLKEQRFFYVKPSTGTKPKPTETEDQEPKEKQPEEPPKGPRTIIPME